MPASNPRSRDTYAPEIRLLAESDGDAADISKCLLSVDMEKKTRVTHRFPASFLNHTFDRQ